MAISTIHKLDKVVFPSSVEFACTGRQSLSAGIQSMLERPAGHVHPMFRANQSQQPVVEFSTPQLGTLLANVPVGGASVGASVVLYLKLATATGNAARNASSHKTITIASSVAHWSTVRLPHNGKGEADVIVSAVYDGSNAPFAYAGSTTLSGNLTATTFFGAGPVAINGTAVAGVQEITIESGIQLFRGGGESELFDTFIGVEMTAPVVTIRTLTERNWSTLGLSGLALNGTAGITFYARKFAANGSRVSDVTAEHIKFVGALGSAIPVNTSGENSSPISDTLRCELVSASDSVAPLIITADSAIS